MAALVDLTGKRFGHRVAFESIYGVQCVVVPHYGPGCSWCRLGYPTSPASLQINGGGLRPANRIAHPGDAQICVQADGSSRLRASYSNFSN